MKLLKLLRCLANGVLCAIIVPFMPLVACICIIRKKVLDLSPALGFGIGVYTELNRAATAPCNT